MHLAFNLIHLAIWIMNDSIYGKVTSLERETWKQEGPKT